MREPDGAAGPINPEWKSLFERHEAIVFAVIHEELRWTRKHPRIRHDDLEQQGRLSLIRHLQSLKPGEEFHATFARRTVAGDLRRHLNEDHAIRVPQSTRCLWRSKGEDFQGPVAGPLTEVVTDNFAIRDPEPEFVDPRFVPLPKRLIALLDRLTPLQREAIERIVIGDETAEAVAEETGRDPRAVRASVRAGLANLRRFLGAEAEPITTDLAGAIAMLSERARVIARRCLVEGAGTSEVARELGIPTKKAKEMRHQARRRLKTLMGSAFPF